jgi:hypothetical protein
MYLFLFGVTALKKQENIQYWLKLQKNLYQSIT